MTNLLGNDLQLEGRNYNQILGFRGLIPSLFYMMMSFEEKLMAQ